MYSKDKHTFIYGLDSKYSIHRSMVFNSIRADKSGGFVVTDEFINKSFWTYTAGTRRSNYYSEILGVLSGDGIVLRRSRGYSNCCTLVYE